VRVGIRDGNRSDSVETPLAIEECLAKNVDVGFVQTYGLTQSMTSGKAGGLKKVEPLKAVRCCEPLKAVRL